MIYSVVWSSNLLETAAYFRLRKFWQEKCAESFSSHSASAPKL